ncbi:MAG: SNF2-related protein [Verrucomicrobiota bacterium]
MAAIGCHIAPRMSGWTESTLRGAASWQAFKEGKSLCEAGAATAVKHSPDGWQGTVREGRRLLRVSVRIKSAADFDTRCACPHNQSSGAICAHAVAVGLAALRGTANLTTKPPASPALPEQAWDIHFAPNWREALGRGHLAATLSRNPEPLTPAGQALDAWLAGAGAAAKSPLHLQLEHSRLATFLDALIGHPRITIGKAHTPLEILATGKIQLRELTLENSHVRLIPEPDAPQPLAIAGRFWQIGPDSLARIGEDNLPADLAVQLAGLRAGLPVELPCQEFLARLEAWQEWLGFPPASWLDELHFVAAPFTVALALEGSLQHLEARLSIRYPNAPPVPPGHATLTQFPRLTANHCCEVRNLDLEIHVASRLAHAGFDASDPAAGRWTLRDENAILHFLTHTLPDLRREWSVTEGERFRNTQRLVVLIQPKIEILGSGEDWLDFNLTFQSDVGDIFSAADVRHLLRSSKGQRTTADGRRLIVSSDVSEVMEPLFAELDLRQEGGHYSASARAAETIHEICKKLDKSLPANHSDDLSTFQLPRAIRAELRPYQNHGAAWLWDRVERFGGALLADDMGLGKTLQAIVLIERVFELAPPQDATVVLVVASASLLGNWHAEFSRFAPQRRVRTLHGAGRDDERERVSSGEVVLTSFATLARDLAWHLRRDYGLVVVDEASLMRNPDTDHAKALSKLRAKRRIALTGTPVENGIRDLWSIFRFILPDWLGGRAEFRERYELPLVSGTPVPALLERLRLKTAPFLLRRTKEQVAPELPSKLIIDEFCDLSPEQQAVYRNLLVEGRKRVETLQDASQPGAARMQMLTALLRLRQTCCDLALLGSERFKQLLVAQRSAKLQRLFELLVEALSGNHKVLIFSQFQTQLREIEKCLIERGWDSLRLDGQTRNRQAMVDRFQSPDGPPIFLISLKAGGYGLNLTAADTVIHFDPWWNPAAEAQASDRAHRIGQTRPVTVYRLLTRGTVEEKVLRLQAKKRELASAIDEAGLSDAPSWSAAELLAIMDDPLKS